MGVNVVGTEKIKLNPVSAQYAQQILADHWAVKAEKRRRPNVAMPLVSVDVDGNAFVDEPHNAAAAMLVRIADEACSIDFFLPCNTLEHLVAHFMSKWDNRYTSARKVFTKFARYVLTVGHVKMIFRNRASHVIVAGSTREITEGMVGVVVD
jgi:hypothetical protein